MLNAGFYIEVNQGIIRRNERAIRMIDRGVFKTDSEFVKRFGKETLLTQIALLTEQNEYLKGFDPEHILTSAEVRQYRAIGKEYGIKNLY